MESFDSQRLASVAEGVEENNGSNCSAESAVDDSLTGAVRPADSVYMYRQKSAAAASSVARGKVDVDGVNKRTSVDSIYIHKKRLSSVQSENEMEVDPTPSKINNLHPSNRFVSHHRDSFDARQPVRAVCDAYIEKMTQTPHKSLQKSISTPDLSGKKRHVCVKTMSFDKPQQKSTSSFREFLGAQVSVLAR